MISGMKLNEKLSEEQIAAFEKVAEKAADDVINSLKEQIPAEIMEAVAGIIKHVYVGGYVSGAEDMYAVMRGMVGQDIPK